MENTINSVVINQDEFTIEDAKEAAKRIFSVEVEDFYLLKNEKWYKHLLNAITFGSDRKKKVIKDIRSLSKLQTIFMHVYYENYKDLDSQLNEIINNLAKTNQVVKKLYLSCVIGIRPQEGLERLSPLDKNILLLTISYYKSINNREEKLQKYRASVAKAIGIGMPEGAFDPEQLEKVAAVEVFYRCLSEMRTIDEARTMPNNIEVALDNLNISNKSKKNIDELVGDEVDCFGIDYMVDKYSSADENYWSDIEWGVAEGSVVYNEPVERQHLNISNECAQIYFKDCFVYDKNKRNIETASYVVYSDEQKIYALHKVSGKKELLLDGIQNAAELFANKCICAHNDAIYYVYNNDLRFIDLSANNEGLITHIDEIYDNENKVGKVWNISYIPDGKMIYRCGYKYYIMSLMDREVIAETSLGSESNNYFVKDNDIYFLDFDSDIDDLGKGLLSGYRIRKYSIDSGEIINVSIPFAKRDLIKEMDGIKAIYNIVSEGLYKDYYYVIFEYNSVSNMNDRTGFDCFCINIKNTGSAEAKSFYIWESHVTQIEQYENYLTYVNGSKGYKLIKHNFVTDKKETLLKNCGSTEKSKFMDRLWLGKDNYMHPSSYMRLGNWIWIQERGKTTPRIISL